jgi:hypothetical protein
MTDNSPNSPTNGPLTDERRLQLDRFLDDDLPANERAEFLRWLDSDPRLAAVLANRAWLALALRQSLRRHRLQSEVLDEAGLSITPSGLEMRQERQALLLRGKLPRSQWTATGVAAVAAILFVAVFFWHGATGSPASAAVVALDRMIEIASESVDRMYRIRVTDHGPDGAEPQLFSDRNGRKPGIDGADLYLRGSNQFVLVRRFGDGTEFVNGSNGVQGWSAPPSGHVHLSSDPRRFRRAVPGEHEDIPFLDLKTGLESLRRGYHLELSNADRALAEEPNWSRLDAVKRSPDLKGPGQVRIWFDSSGVARRIELAGLEKFQESPHSVVLELVEQRDLGPKFFEHESHHAADRPIDWE